MRTLTKTRAIGGSLVVTIPANMVKEKSIKKNEMIEIEVNKIKIDGFGKFKGIGLFREEDRLKGQLEE